MFGYNHERNKPHELLLFPYSIQISAKHWRSLDLGALSRQIAERAIPSIIFYRQLAFKLNRQRKTGVNPVHAGQLNLFATLQKVYRYLIDELAEGQTPGLLMDALRRGGATPPVWRLRRRIHVLWNCFRHGMFLTEPITVVTGSTARIQLLRGNG